MPRAAGATVAAEGAGSAGVCEGCGTRQSGSAGDRKRRWCSDCAGSHSEAGKLATPPAGPAKKYKAESERRMLPIVAGAGQPDVDQSEVYFLIASFLRSGPCAGASEALLRDMAEHKLLPSRHHMGTPFAVSFDEMSRQHTAATGPNAGAYLPELLARLVDVSGRSEVGVSQYANSRTLLGTGSFGLVPRVGRQPVALQRRRRGQRGQQPGGLLSSLLSYQLNGGTAGGRQPFEVPISSFSARFTKLYTILGHMKEVYNAKFDKTGMRLITGSDDKLVKIWAVTTGELIFSMRGHYGDVTMVDVNHSNTLVCSSDNRGQARVWCLHTGRPTDVLTGSIAEDEINHIEFVMINGVDYIVCACVNGTIHTWRMNSDGRGEKLQVIVLGKQPGVSRGRHVAIKCLDVNASETYIGETTRKGSVLEKKGGVLEHKSLLFLAVFSVRSPYRERSSFLQPSHLLPVAVCPLPLPDVADDRPQEKAVF